MGVEEHSPLLNVLPLEDPLKLHKAVYNRIVRDFNDNKPLPVSVFTYSDAPPGSGLGSSSTMVVTMLSAYRQLLGLPLGEYDIARLAYDIERIDCAFPVDDRTSMPRPLAGLTLWSSSKTNEPW